MVTLMMVKLIMVKVGDGKVFKISRRLERVKFQTGKVVRRL